MNIPIFCINLERAIERKKKIEQLWIEDMGFDIIFWKAWDRRDIEDGKFYLPYNEELTQKTIKRQLSSGEIACSTSHYMVHEHCIKNNIENYIVMEDDIYPTKIYKSILEIENLIVCGQKEFPEASIYMLHGNTSQHIKKIIKEKFSSLETPPWGNQINFYNKQGREKMFNSLKDLSCLADHWKVMKFVDLKKDLILVNKGSEVGIHEHIGTSTTYIGNLGRRLQRVYLS